MPDPAAQSAKWGQLFGLEVATLDGIRASIWAERTARFVQGAVKMMTGVDVAVAEGASVVERKVEISGVTFNLV